MISTATFSVDGWKNKLEWVSQRDLLLNQWESKVKILKGIFNQDLEQFDELAEKGEAWIREIDAGIKNLSNSDISVVSEETCLVERQTTQMEEEEHTQTQTVTELQIENLTDLESDVAASTLRKGLSLPGHPATGNPLDLEGNDFHEQVANWKSQKKVNSLFQRVISESRLPSNLIRYANDYNSMKLAFFRTLSQGIGEQFYISQDALTTTTTSQSIFSPLQKNVDFLLITWDPKSAQKHRCVFLSAADVANLKNSEKFQSAAKGNNYIFCTNEGYPIKDGFTSTTDENHRTFIEEACWMAHFFNGDIVWLNSHRPMSEKMFEKMGMAPKGASGQETFATRFDFLKGVTTFLLLKASTGEKKKALVMEFVRAMASQDRQNDYQSFLAEHGLSADSTISSVIDAVLSHNVTSSTPISKNVLTTLRQKLGEVELKKNPGLNEIMQKNGLSEEEYRCLRDQEQLLQGLGATMATATVDLSPPLKFMTITETGEIVLHRNNPPFSSLQVVIGSNGTCAADAATLSAIKSVELPALLASEKVSQILKLLPKLEHLSLDGSVNLSNNDLLQRQHSDRIFNVATFEFQPHGGSQSKSSMDKDEKILESDSARFSGFFASDDDDDDDVVHTSAEPGSSSNNFTYPPLLSDITIRNFNEMDVIEIPSNFVPPNPDLGLTINVEGCPLRAINVDNSKEYKVSGWESIVFSNCVVNSKPRLDADPELDVAENVYKPRSIPTLSVSESDLKLPSPKKAKEICNLFGLELNDVDMKVQAQLPIDSGFEVNEYDRLDEFENFCIGSHPNLLGFSKECPNLPIHPRIFWLQTRSERSVYELFEVNSGLYRHEVSPAFDDRDTFRIPVAGSGQNDANFITNPASRYNAVVSRSPVEPIMQQRFTSASAEAEVRRPFFEALVKANINVICDERRCSNDSNYVNWDYALKSDLNFHPEYSFLQGGTKIPFPGGEAIAEKYFSIVTYTDEKNKTHEILHVRRGNIADGSVPEAEKLREFMQELDWLEEKYGNKFNFRVVLDHCNGGLGRGPSMAIARLLWQISKAAKTYGLGITYDEKQQNLFAIGNDFNLAAALKMILISGLYARSTFVQNYMQFNRLGNFASHIVQNRKDLFDMEKNDSLPLRSWFQPNHSSRDYASLASNRRSVDDSAMPLRKKP
jgi:hypothetical protein